MFCVWPVCVLEGWKVGVQEGLTAFCYLFCHLFLIYFIDVGAFFTILDMAMAVPA